MGTGNSTETPSATPLSLAVSDTTISQFPVFPVDVLLSGFSFLAHESVDLLQDSVPQTPSGGALLLLQF